MTHFSLNLVIGYLLGSWGLVGVGCFFLISAHFLIGHSQSFDIRKLLRLILQVIFWMLTILVAMIILGISLDGSIIKNFAKAILSPFIGTYWFITAYIFMYLLYPFINYFIEKMNLVFYERLMVLLTIIVPLFTFGVNRNNLTICDLGIALYYYLLCGYLKKTPNNFFEKHAEVIFWFTNALTVILEIICDLISPLTKIGIERIQGRYSILAIISAISLFYIFKNLKIKPSKFINTIAKGTLGVYLIHECPFLTKKLWNNAFNLAFYFKTSSCFIIYYIASVIVIYCIAVLLDLIRLNLFEKPLFKLKIPFLEKYFNKINSYIKKAVF